VADSTGTTGQGTAGHGTAGGNTAGGNRAAAALARFDQINRELADRRALRERRAAEAKRQASESLTKRGLVAERAAQHLAELGRRARAQSGWAIERSRTGEENVLTFGVEDDTGADVTEEVPPPQTARTVTPRDEDDDFSNETYLT